MSDIDTTTEGTETEEPEHIRNLREQAKDGTAAVKRLAEMEKDVALMRLGVDLSSKQAGYFRAGYSGDWSDAEALKTELTEVGLLKAEGTTTETTEVTTETTEPTGTDERRAMASGATAEGDAGLDPRQVALDRAREAEKKGATAEEVGAAHIAALAEAAHAGDQRVLVQGNADRR